MHSHTHRVDDQTRMYRRAHMMAIERQIPSSDEAIKAIQRLFRIRRHSAMHRLRDQCSRAACWLTNGVPSKKRLDRYAVVRAAKAACLAADIDAEKIDEVCPELPSAVDMQRLGLRMYKTIAREARRAPKKMRGSALLWAMSRTSIYRRIYEDN